MISCEPRRRVRGIDPWSYEENRTRVRSGMFRAGRHPSSAGIGQGLPLGVIDRYHQQCLERARAEHLPMQTEAPAVVRCTDVVHGGHRFTDWNRE